MKAERRTRIVPLTGIAVVILVLSVGFFPALDALQTWRERVIRAAGERAFEPYRRYYDQTSAVERAARSRGPAAVRRMEHAAEEILRIAEANALPLDSWNRGNALHYGHVLLGRLALLDGNVAQARAHLLKAGDTPGSPQLDDFGPDMTLADELLAHGEREAVLKYFEECRRFWLRGGADRLANWSAAVRAGNRPDFGRRSGLSPAVLGAVATGSERP